jgi:hypothetical protein
MRTRILLCLCAALLPGLVANSAGAQQAKEPTTKPAATDRTTMLMTVTDPVGWTLPAVKVSVTGPLTREGDTDESGTLRLTGIRPGTYRARFSGETVVTFEREIIVQAGRIAEVDVTLNLAEEKPDPPPAPPPPLGPVGQPLAASLIDLVERELIGRDDPRRESLVACSGNTRSTLLQLNQEQPQRLYAGAESMLYVIAGEGSARIDARDLPLVPGSFVSVPRSVPYTLVRSGKRPLIMLSVLSGEPCEQAQ